MPVRLPSALQEQVARLDVREPGPQPLLLFLDDRGDLAVDENAVRRGIDLALGVAEPSDRLALGVILAGRGDAVGHRGQAVERAGADLAGPAPGEDLQQDHAHRLRVVEAVGEHLGAVAAGDLHLLLAGQAEQRQRGGDLRQGVVVDVVPVVEGRLVRDAGDLAEPAGRVRVGDLLGEGPSTVRASARLAARNANSSATARRSSLISRGGTTLGRRRFGARSGWPGRRPTAGTRRPARPRPRDRRGRRRGGRRRWPATGRSAAGTGAAPG